MTNPLKHVQDLGRFSEASAVVRTAVVVLDGDTYRIDVLKGYVPATTAYTARCAVLRQVSTPVLTPATPPTDALREGTVMVWVDHPLSPPVACDRPKEALAEVLSRLVPHQTPEATSPRRSRRRTPAASSTSDE